MHIKEVWRENIPYVLAEMNFQQAAINPTTPAGVRAATLARTDDPDRADKAKLQADVAITMANLPK